MVGGISRSEYPENFASQSGGPVEIPTAPLMSTLPPLNGPEVILPRIVTVFDMTTSVNDPEELLPSLQATVRDPDLWSSIRRLHRWVDRASVLWPGVHVARHERADRCGAAEQRHDALCEVAETVDVG